MLLVESFWRLAHAWVSHRKTLRSLAERTRQLRADAGGGFRFDHRNGVRTHKSVQKLSERWSKDIGYWHWMVFADYFWIRPGIDVTFLQPNCWQAAHRWEGAHERRPKSAGQILIQLGDWMIVICSGNLRRQRKSTIYIYIYKYRFLEKYVLCI